VENFKLDLKNLRELGGLDNIGFLGREVHLRYQPMSVFSIE